MTRSRISAAFFAAVLGFGTNCVGDNSHKVDYHNSGAVAVLVYESDLDKPHARRLGPGETLHDQWLVPPVWSGKLSGQPHRLQASTESGERIFCHVFTYEELDRLGWVIEITQRNDCT
jgi:hypothetical protein